MKYNASALYQSLENIVALSDRDPAEAGLLA